MLDLEHMAETLEASGNYRVLRRIEPRAVFDDPSDTDVCLNGIILDTETTGLDHVRDEIIELAMVPFTFCQETGRVFVVGTPFHALREPTIPIPAEITEITGLDAAAVAGHSIDPRTVEAFVEPAQVIVAHHAAFDRPFMERFSTAFGQKGWACSMSEIDWRAEGLRSTRLASLVADVGLFYDGHRAVHDCHALLELLAAPLPKSGKLAFAALLEKARQPTYRVWAIDSPFEVKDRLKARGYRWNNGDNGLPKSWFYEGGEEALNAELDFLAREIFRREVDLRVDRLTAFTRFKHGGM